MSSLRLSGIPTADKTTGARMGLTPNSATPDSAAEPDSPRFPGAGLYDPQFEHIAGVESLAVLGWREVPHDATACGASSLAVLPRLVQLFVASTTGDHGIDLDRRAFCLRKRAEHEAGVYLASLSSATIVYKGMLTALQLERFYPDLTH